jgi:uncharacterized protein (TIGR02001 family)
MKKTLIATAVTGALLTFAASAMAEDAAAAAPAAPASPWTITTNVYGVSDYYFRGITQTWHKPAIQGGVDVAHSSGWYVGAWGSNVSNNEYPGGSGLEFDYYGGYNGKFNDDWGWTAGGHGYYYPGADFNKAAVPFTNQKFNSFEFNVGFSYKFLSVKYSRFSTDWFGINKNTGYSEDSSGTGYLEFNAAYEVIPTYTVNFHAASTNVKAKTAGGLSLDYSDYVLGITKAFDGGWSASAAYVKANFKDGAAWKPYFSFANGDSLSDPGSGRLIVSVGRVF